MVKPKHSTLANADQGLLDSIVKLTSGITNTENGLEILDLQKQIAELYAYMASRKLLRETQDEYIPPRHKVEG